MSLLRDRLGLVFIAVGLLALAAAAAMAGWSAALAGAPHPRAGIAGDAGLLLGMACACGLVLGASAALGLHYLRLRRALDCLDRSIHAAPCALAVFDPQERLVAWSDTYAHQVEGDAARLARGMQLADVVPMRGQATDGGPLAARRAAHAPEVRMDAGATLDGWVVIALSDPAPEVEDRQRVAG